MDFRYKFTIFTPCYNSEKTLHRVFDSLMAQTIDHNLFEWLVINDCSKDGTNDLIQEYIKKADFDIQYFNLEKNQMIIKNFNMAIKNAKGELFMIIGHDDAFTPNALEVMYNYWINKIEPQKDVYSGLIHHTINQKGEFVGTKFPQDEIDMTPVDMLKNRVFGEKRGFIQTRILRDYLFPEDIDVYISEETNWLKIGKKYKSFAINQNLVIYYENDGVNDSLSRSSKIKYVKGSIYSAIEVINYFSLIDLFIYNTKYFFMHFMNISRMSYHNHSIFAPLKSIDGICKRVVYLLFIPLGILKALKDKKQGRI